MEAEMRQREAIKVTKWIAENPKIMRRILNVEECTTPEVCIEVIEVLEKQFLEYLIPILLYTTNYNDVMEKVMSRIYAESMTKTWEQLGTEHMLGDIKSKIREEIKLKEFRKNGAY